MIPTPTPSVIRGPLQFRSRCAPATASLSNIRSRNVNAAVRGSRTPCRSAHGWMLSNSWRIVPQAVAGRPTPFNWPDVGVDIAGPTVAAQVDQERITHCRPTF